MILGILIVISGDYSAIYRVKSFVMEMYNSK